VIGYLGTPAALLALPYRGGLTVESDRPVSEVRTLGGKRKIMVGSRTRRTWGVDFDLLGSLDAAGLLAVARHSSAVMWYPSDAAAGNLLSPQASGWEPSPTNATPAGLVALPDGSVANSIVPFGTVRVGDAHGAYEMVPVRPGVSVSVGAWAQGGLGFQGYWRDATGAQMTTYLVSAVTHSGWKWRQSVLTPPAGAAYIELQLFGGTAYARPSISWGSVAVDRPGRGCPKAFVHGVSEALTVVRPEDSYGSISATISEVG